MQIDVSTIWTWGMNARWNQQIFMDKMIANLPKKDLTWVIGWDRMVITIWAVTKICRFFLLYVEIWRIDYQTDIRRISGYDRMGYNMIYLYIRNESDPKRWCFRENIGRHWCWYFTTFTFFLNTIKGKIGKMYQPAKHEIPLPSRIHHVVR